MRPSFVVALIVSLLLVFTSAFGEPPDTDPPTSPSLDGGLTITPPKPRPAKFGECVWQFVDAVDVRDGFMPAEGALTQETRTRLCYHGFAYSLTTFQRFVDASGKHVTEWTKTKSHDYDTTLWLTIEEGGKPGGAPPWGKDVFDSGEPLPE
jgi:hypothetical protein